MSTAVIVVPCYNEEQRIPVDSFRAFARGADDVRFILVDDGSTDATRTLLNELAALDAARFEVLALAKNSGKAEAVRSGMLTAFGQGADYVGFWDADLSTPLSSIREFCEILDARPEIEMVFGARVKLLGRCVERRARRHYLGRVFATVASTMLKLSVYDTQCGAKLFRASPEVEDLFRDPFRTNWIFDVEIIARLIRQRAQTGLPGAEAVIYELPLPQWCDVGGSKVTWKSYLHAAADLAKVYRHYG